VTNTTTHLSSRLRFFGTPVSLAASLASVSSDGTKFHRFEKHANARRLMELLSSMSFCSVVFR
jgi:hypothetical protein